MFNHQDTMPTFNKAFKEVGIVPISIICFMENRHKGAKEGENLFGVKTKESSVVETKNIESKSFFSVLGALGALVVQDFLLGLLSLREAKREI
jgi:hypothetical protein